MIRYEYDFLTILSDYGYIILDYGSTVKKHMANFVLNGEAQMFEAFFTVVFNLPPLENEIRTFSSIINDIDKLTNKVATLLN